MQKENLEISISSGFPKLLENAGITLALSTYQAGKVILISASNGRIQQRFKSFQKPMGIAVCNDKLAVASLNEVRTFKNAPRLAGNYPEGPNQFDALYLPRAVYFSGTTDLHDLSYLKNELHGVNTLFSCVVKINDDYSFEPIWQPSFISDLEPEDRCHLNGIAVEDDKIKFISCLSKTNVKNGWRKDIVNTGAIIDYQSNEVFLDGLAMPHSPRIYGNKLIFLQSAKGLVTIYNQETGTLKNIELNCFPRGMVCRDGLAFIGVSKIRETSKSFKILPVKDVAKHAGIKVIEIESGLLVGEMRYENIISEIYDVQILENRRPNLINHEDKVHNRAIAAKNLNYWMVKKEK
jgi:uncharacterized protein (TIGR03032 family)